MTFSIGGDCCHNVTTMIINLIIRVGDKDFRELDKEGFGKQFFQLLNIVITIFIDKHGDSDRLRGFNPIEKLCLDLPGSGLDGF